MVGFKELWDTNRVIRQMVRAVDQAVSGEEDFSPGHLRV